MAGNSIEIISGDLTVVTGRVTLGNDPAVTVTWPTGGLAITGTVRLDEPPPPAKGNRALAWLLGALTRIGLITRTR